jgi:thymidine kinase
MSTSTNMSVTQPSHAGALTLLLGPMFSGKSTALIRALERHTLAGRRACLFKYARDTRYSSNVSELKTHNGSAKDALPVEDLTFTSAYLESLFANVDVIGIDEGQFYEHLTEFVVAALAAGKHVLVAALDGFYDRAPVTHVLELVALANSATKLHAVCSTCGADAPFTRRLVAAREHVLVGGAAEYAAACRACYEVHAAAAAATK